MTMTPTEQRPDCYYRYGRYCTLGDSGRVVTIEEGFNENGKFYERASIAGKGLRLCNADDCPLKQTDP